MFIKLLALFALLLHCTYATIYYVTTDDKHLFHTTDNFHTLEYYLANPKTFFLSHTSLYFLPGHHHLSTDLTIRNAENFTLAGKDSTIVCTPPAGIIVAGTSNFKLMNMSLLNCGKDNYHYFHSRISSFFSTSFHQLHFLSNGIKFIKCNVSLLLDNCTSVVIKNVNISINIGFVGLFAVNMKNVSIITDLSVHLNCSTCPSFYSHISGIIFYYYRGIMHLNEEQKSNALINLFNYQYKTYGSCPYRYQYAIVLLLFQKNHNVSVNIQRLVMKNLENSSMLFYSGKASDIDVASQVTIKNFIICNNIGNTQLKMFHIELYNYREKLEDLSFLRYNQQRNMINIENYTFANNTNMAAMIHLTPSSSRVVAGYIKLKNGTFCNNSQLHFITVKSKAEIIWQLTTIIEVAMVRVFSNRHTDGDSLIFITNGAIHFKGPVIFMNNTYYANIIELHLSVGMLQGSIQLTANVARQILKAKRNSYFMLQENSIVNMSQNTVYIVATQIHSFGVNSRPICPIQFFSFRGNIDKSPTVNLPYKILMLENLHMISRDLPGKDMSFGNCTWLAGTAFYKAPAKSIYQQVMKITNIHVNKTTKRLIPLSVCQCFNTTDYDCYSPYLGSLFPGQTISIKLLVEKKWIQQGNPSTTIMVANTPNDDECSVVDSYQLSQTYFNHGCNNYSYTIWPSHEHINECKLFVGIKEMPEMFYIGIKPCPMGFTLDENRKACHCDPLLDNGVVSVTSCDLNDQTILRPANSWITADTINGSHTYLVSSSCPFDYCLPYSSHHNLSDPDSQCQYNRSGVLCGQCRQGLSSVFGSSHCMHCSNIYLLLMIPIGITGIILVMMLFMFDLTVANGTISSFILYFNILSINSMIIFPGCQSIICQMIMFINLDIGTRTCFYNGMDDYAIAWLLLAIPTYLIVIALFLIVMSRYSSVIQKITAKKALPVLATLFLLSYTKILRNVCRVLFRYSTFTHLPTNHVNIVWLISTNTPLFGLKFIVLFVICIILFLILLPFNVILLFTRTLSCFKFVTTFKPLLDVYFAPFKDKAFYWTGLLLIIRTITLVFSAFEENVSLTVTSVLFGGLLWWHGVVRPFRSKFENIQESLLSLILIMVHAFPLCKVNQSTMINLTQAIIASSVIYFALVIVYCSFLCKFKNNFLRIIEKGFYRIKGPYTQGSFRMRLVRSDTVDVTCQYQEFQEPLVEFDQ